MGRWNVGGVRNTVAECMILKADLQINANQRCAPCASEPLGRFQISSRCMRQSRFIQRLHFSCIRNETVVTLTLTLRALLAIIVAATLDSLFIYFSFAVFAAVYNSIQRTAISPRYCAPCILYLQLDLVALSYRYSPSQFLFLSIS